MQNYLFFLFIKNMYQYLGSTAHETSVGEHRCPTELLTSAWFTHLEHRRPFYVKIYNRYATSMYRKSIGYNTLHLVSLRSEYKLHD